MSLHTATDIQRSAQRSYDGQSEIEDVVGEVAADLARDFIHDEQMCIEAHQWVAGSLSDSHYTDVSLALHQLHHMDPADLLGSALLERLYALAAVEAEAIDEQLLELAVQQVAA